MATNINFKNIKKEEGDWMVVVNPMPASWNVNVYLLNRRDGIDSIANINKDGLLELKPLKESELNPTPLLNVPAPVWQLLVDAITESTPPTKKEVIEGILDATKFHLADMRKLVFEDKNKITLSTDYLCGHGSCLPGKCNYKDDIKK